MAAAASFERLGWLLRCTGSTWMGALLSWPWLSLLPFFPLLVLFGGCFINSHQGITVMAIVVIVALPPLAHMLGLLLGGCFINSHRGVGVVAVVSVVILLSLACVFGLLSGGCFINSHQGITVMAIVVVVPVVVVVPIVVTVLPLVLTFGLLFSFLGPAAAAVTFTIGLVAVVTVACSRFIAARATGLCAVIAAAIAVGIAVTAVGVALIAGARGLDVCLLVVTL
jgi:hypothetical protein